MFISAKNTKAASSSSQFNTKLYENGILDSNKFQYVNSSAHPKAAAAAEPLPLSLDLDILSQQPGPSHSNFDFTKLQLKSGTKDQPCSSKEIKLDLAPPVNCICESHIWRSFMIKCHGCNEHYHGDCVGISRPKAVTLKHFYCTLCIDKNPNLVTEFEEDTSASKEKKESKNSKKKNKRR